MPKTIISTDNLQLDNTIKVVTAGLYAADNGIVRSEFYQTGNRVVFENNGRRFTWTPQEMKYIDALGMEDVIYTVQDVPLETKANYARFNRAMPDVDDWFIQENTQLKHQILIQGFQRDPLPFLTSPIDFCIGGQIEHDADLRIYSDGTEQTSTFETDGEIQFQDADGNTIFNLPKVVAYDSKIPERAMTYGKYRVYVNGGGLLAFQFVLDNAWISDVERVYPIVIDPTVVVSSAYDTSGNGGRKLVKLSNGWLVCAVRTTATPYQIIFYKSEDNGTTWTRLCYMEAADETRILIDHAIASNGTRIMLLLAWDYSSSTDYVHSYSFDAATQTDVNIVNDASVISDQIEGQDEIARVSVSVDSNGAFHAVWSSKNATYPNSFNLRYSKTTDNGETWASPTQLTTDNSTSYTNKNQCIVLKSNNNPVLIFEGTQGSSEYIYSMYYDGTSWSSRLTIVGEAYNKEFACAAIDSNDVIHAVWHGTDATDTLMNNIRYAKSSDGGATWSAVTKLTSGNSYHQKYPSITIDKNNKLYVFFHGRGSGSYDKIRKVEYDGSAWSTIMDLTANTTAHAQYPSSLWSKFNMNSDDAVRWIWQDLQASAVQYDYIAVNSSPNAPTLGTRSNFDATSAATFTWTFSDPNGGDTQSAYQLLIKRESDGVTVFDSGKVASTTSSHTLTANTLTNNFQYQWQVKTWDNSDAVGPYSALSSFYTSAKPTVTITDPATDGATVTTTSLTAQWSLSDPESEGQSSYQVKLTDNADAVLWDSGKVTDVAARSRTISYTLVNSTNYKVKVTVWDAKDIASTEAVRTFVTSFTVPATPTIALSANNANGYISISITNPAPTGGQPTVNSNDIYRRTLGESTWTRIAAAFTGSTYNDYAVASGVTYEYKVRANGSNSTTADSAISTASITLSGVWLHDVSDPTATVHNFKYDGQGRDINWQAEVSMMQFAGRSRPVAEFGESGEGSISATLQMLKSEVDIVKLDSLVKRKGTICYRDGRGRKMFGIISALPLKDEHWGYTTTIEVIETSYGEDV